MDDRLIRLKELACYEYSIPVEEVRLMITIMTNFIRDHLVRAGHPERNVRAILTKFRDAGRRSPPWKPASARVPGRPQDGADGNRRLRWLFEADHKFYANEIDATLVEVRYYLQTLSMLNAPPLPEDSIQESFIWLTAHPVVPNAYLDPIQLVNIDLNDFVANPRMLHSGHLTPLDRGGRHEPQNAFLILQRSNQLQGNLTLPELLTLMEEIVLRHKAAVGGSDPEAEINRLQP